MEKQKTVINRIEMQIVNSLVLEVAGELQSRGGDNLPLVELLLQASEIISRLEKEADLDADNED